MLKKFVLSLSLVATVALQGASPIDFLKHKEYYWGGQKVAGRIPVFYEGDLMPLNHLNFFEILHAQEKLEELLESNPNQVPGGETALRKMLRAIRYRLGPNLNLSQTLLWEVNSVIIPRMEVTWTDKQGKKRFFKTKIESEAEWKSNIEREMRYLSNLIYLLSWGKILIKGKVTVSKIPITQLVKSGTNLVPHPFQIKAAIENAFPGPYSRGYMVWIPDVGEGDRPSWPGTAYTSGDKAFMNGAIGTALHTSEERLKLDHGWAKPDGGGLIHEFWHQVEHWLKIQHAFKGFIPSNHSSSDVQKVLDEIKEAKLPAPYLYYAELYGALPTWTMLRKLE